MELNDRTHLALSRVQFIAEVSLVADLSVQELQMALSMISDLADACLPDNDHEEIFYKAKDS
ncbi:hypothetical protein I6H07_05550 [Hafnia alvei]|jgi:hypothetical protein|uniref:hypothetical protein n=1 Tax=Hafniaceae TaxID=1903412 RepID=UPI000778B686|nr:MULTISPECIES: hypothetical protein [Hafniaceae]MDN6448280.1 hypothetical protein [Enterobacterales bacterium]AMO81159.1 hypothetical protein DSM2777_08975 [Obesumbacterium proteus]ANC42401.1 hypothetical protein A6V27_19515 [Hafnia alvei]MBI0275304.1 hypothetical protein [Hafnia alvei]MDN6681632.1 hypothetical protein [Enterobacterales bacterium]